MSKQDKHDKTEQKARIEALVIPSKCFLKKGELAKIKQEIIEKGLTQSQAQEYLEKENAACETVYVKAIRNGYYETQRYREGQKFYCKKKYLPSKWMVVIDSSKQEAEDDDEPVRPAFDGRSAVNREVI